MLTRRQFLISLAAATGYTLLPLGRYGFAMQNAAPVQKRLIVLLLRGAVDGLSVVVPYRESDYYRKRTSIALNPPGRDGGVLDLDGFFGLHPSLSPLMPFWSKGSLAFVHASGIPNDVRSHFEAQDIIETASLDAVHPQGWMNALISALPAGKSPTAALSFSNKMPKIFTGANNVASVAPGIKADSKSMFANPKAEHDFDALYAGSAVLNHMYQEAKQSRDQIIADLQKEMLASGGNAPFPDGFPGEAARLAAMIRQDPGIEIAFMDLGGWDTHVNQGSAKGQLAGKLEKLGAGLSTLAQDLGGQYGNTVIMVMSEFGRTVAENGNGGTDHGHGNAVWLMGGGVRGGKVHGNWPGLGDNQLFEGRDLNITTDFREVIATVVRNQFGLDNTSIAHIIPGFTPENSLSLFA